MSIGTCPKLDGGGAIRNKKVVGIEKNWDPNYGVTLHEVKLGEEFSPLNFNAYMHGLVMARVHNKKEPNSCIVSYLASV